MSAPSVPTLSAELPSGSSMPLLGFGTWQITGSEATRTTAAALAAGYRHIDTATVYGNEAEVGAALTDSGIDRSQVFVTTKVPGGTTDADSTLTESLAKLQTAYVDLWLIHWPTGDADATMWAAMAEAQAGGLARDIGVSNFSLTELDALIAQGPKPAVNQIEWSPLLFDAEVLAGHQERGVVLEGYSALRGGTLDHPEILAIAERAGRTAAQVIIRWHLQHGVVVIPKSANEQRIIANADVGGFELSSDDMSQLDALGGSATPS